VKWEDIAFAFNKSPAALRKEYHRYCKIIDLPPKINVVQRVTDGRIGSHIKRIRVENPKLPFRNFRAELLKLGHDPREIPSFSTISRFLKTNGFIHRKLSKKTFISSVNCQKRVSFCQEMVEKGPEFWDRVIWSDETTVRQSPKSKDVFVHVHLSTKREDMEINSQIHSGGFSVMFWGCMSKLGLGPLVALEGNMTADRYVELLRDTLIPELEAAGKEMVFMQDNAPCHKAKRVMKYFQENNIMTLDWPAQSPDMNPIENLWAIIKHRRQQKFGVPKSKNDLIEQIFNIWENIEEELVSKLADSANKRVSEVLRLNGNISKY
jgi:transposase